MNKLWKLFFVSLAATLAGLGIYHYVKRQKLLKGILAEGETYEDPEPTGCCGAEFTEKQKKKLAKEPIEKPEEAQV